jgi:hypothetical protein
LARQDQELKDQDLVIQDQEALMTEELRKLRDAKDAEIAKLKAAAVRLYRFQRL